MFCKTYFLFFKFKNNFKKYNQLIFFFLFLKTNEDIFYLLSKYCCLFFFKNTIFKSYDQKYFKKFL